MQKRHTETQPPLDVLVAKRVRRLRQQGGMSQENLALEMQRMGFGGWTSSVVAALESGRRRLGLGEVLGLALLFRVPLSDLMPPPPARGWLPLNDRLLVSPKAVRALLTGEGMPDIFRRKHVSVEERGIPLTEPISEDTKEALIQFALHGLASLARLERIPEAALKGDLEVTIAKRLVAEGLLEKPDTRVVVAAAYGQWGRSPTEERDARGAEQDRGKQWISRDIADEIVKQVREALPKAQEKLGAELAHHATKKKKKGKALGRREGR